jgi:hypothetical protein
LAPQRCKGKGCSQRHGWVWVESFRRNQGRLAVVLKMLDAKGQATEACAATENKLPSLHAQSPAPDKFERTSWVYIASIRVLSSDPDTPETSMEAASAD